MGISYQSTRVQKNGITGEGWRVSQPIGQPLLCLQSLLGKRRVNVYTPEGRPHRFEIKFPDNGDCQLGAPPDPKTLRAYALGTTSSTLEILDTNGLIVQGGVIYDLGLNETWNPKRFRLTTEEGFIYDLNEDVGITSVRDPNGNKVDFTSAGILHSDGSGVQFTRNAQGESRALWDPAGKAIVYDYDGADNLITATSRTGAAARFEYDQSHGMVSYTDADGFPQLKIQYDAQGRVKHQDRPMRMATRTRSISASRAANKETFTDRRNATTTYTYDSLGNVTEVQDGLGKVTKYGYDADDNESSTTNPLNQTKSKTFGRQGADAVGDRRRWVSATTYTLGNITKLPVQIADPQPER